MVHRSQSVPPEHFKDLHFLTGELIGNVQYEARTSSEETSQIATFSLFAYYTWKSIPLKPVIVLTAGVHGDEIAGVEALQLFTAQKMSAYQQDYEFLLIPRVNPWGSTFFRRENGDEIDINRHFVSDSHSQEAKLITGYIKEKMIRACLSIDFHEDVVHKNDGEFKPPTAFYLYERTASGLILGPHITKKVGETFPVSNQSSIYGETALHGCVFSADLDERTLENFFYQQGADVALTFETPTCWELERRIQAHIIALEEAIHQFKQLPKILQRNK